MDCEVHGGNVFVWNLELDVAERRDDGRSR